MPRVLIAGCGYVGTALGERLCAAGYDVLGLRRQPPPHAPFPQLSADLGRPETLRNLPEVAAVVYTAAADSGSDAAYRAAYVTGLGNLLAALQDQGQQPRRLLFTSSTSVYGQQDGEWVDETSATEPRHFSGRRLLEAEALLRQTPLPASVLRLGGIYGPGRTRLIDSVRRGTATCPQGPPRFTNRIHLDDCAGALHHLLELPAPEPLYLGVDCEPADSCTVTRWIAAQLGLPEPSVVAAEEAAGVRGGNKRCRNDRLQATGYRFRYPSFREGYGELITAVASRP